MKENGYRMANWWLLWGDLLLPEPAIKEKPFTERINFEQLRIALSKRSSNTTLTLVEMDFWAKK